VRDVKLFCGTVDTGDSKSEFTDFSVSRTRRLPTLESSCNDLVGRGDRFEAPALVLEFEVCVERELD
jgi:hypothetical protein